MGAKRRLEPRTALRIREACLAYVREQQLLPADARILLAVSGGRDSMAMLSIFHHIGRWPLAVAHCNFTLRGDESDADQALVEEVCQRWQIPVHVMRFATQEWAHQHGCSIQVAARELRYGWFEQLRVQLGFTHIATAHHAGDVAEGLLLNMARGAGLRGMGGMPARNGHVVRPLLSLLPSDIAQWVEAMEVPYRNDTSNASDRYMRNYVRHHVVPALETVNPQAVENLLHAADSAQMAHRALTEVATQLWGAPEGGPSGSPLVFPWHRACMDGRQQLAEWWIGECLSARGFNRSQVYDALTALRAGHTGASVRAGDCEAYVARGELYVVESSAHEELAPGGVRTYNVGDCDAWLSVQLMEGGPDVASDALPKAASQRVALLDADTLTLPLELRHWRDGDRLIPFCMRGSKKVSDLLTDAKVIPPYRKRALVLISRGRIVWVVGLRIDDRHRLTDSTRRVLRIEALPACPVPLSR